MYKLVIQEFLRPAVTRVGTVVGVYLASADLFTQAQIDVLSQGSVILAGLLLDLVVRKVL
jgi:hypothetical protein